MTTYSTYKTTNNTDGFPYKICRLFLERSGSQKSPIVHLLASRLKNLRLYACWRIVLKDTKRGVGDGAGEDKRSLKGSPKTPCRQTDLQKRCVRLTRKVHDWTLLESGKVQLQRTLPSGQCGAAAPAAPWRRWRGGGGRAKMTSVLCCRSNKVTLVCPPRVLTSIHENKMGAC